MDVRRRTFVSAGLVGMSTVAPPVFDSDPGTYHCESCLIQLWKLSFENKCLTLHYPENLNSFAKREEKLCCPTRGQTANEISGPSLQ